MHRLPLITGLLLLSIGTALAQTKGTKAPSGPEVRYFTYLNGLMEDRADVVLKETRQGARVVAASLDVCFPMPADANRTDRFTVTLAVDGDKLSGSTESQENKLPVSVSLTRKANGKAFDFNGRITIGQSASTIASAETSDLSEKEFKEQQAAGDTITVSPADFTEVSPEAVAVKVKRDAVVDFTRSLRGENMQVALYGLIASCAELRSGEQVLRLTVDPERAPSVLEKLRAQPGVVIAGWTEGNMDMERTIRFPGRRMARDRQDQSREARRQHRQFDRRVVTGDARRFQLERIDRRTEGGAEAAERNPARTRAGREDRVHDARVARQAWRLGAPAAVDRQPVDRDRRREFGPEAQSGRELQRQRRREPVAQ